MLLVGVRQFLIIGHLNQKLLTQMEIFRHGEIPKCAQSATTPDKMKPSHGHHTRRQHEHHHRSNRLRHHVACADHYGGSDMTILEYIGLVPIVAAIVAVVGYCIAKINP